MAEIFDYRSSGVDREAADRLVGKITELTRSTLLGKASKKIKSSVGGYASLYEVSRDRLIAASTDGVGTKLKLAFELGIHDTVGIDLVAMSVNDLICVGARPLFFLDYLATGKLKTGIATKVIEGVVAGCRQAECALVGGETAEMPGFYTDGEYDLAGFAVGEVHPKDVLPRKNIKPGDRLIGVASTGFHSNGFSLLRRLLDLEKTAKSRRVRARSLLTPTQIYVKSMMPLLRDIKGLAHITGSGFLNVPRVSDRVSYEITLPPLKELPECFTWVRKISALPLQELAQTFNMGIGLVAVVDSKKEAALLRKIKKSGLKAWSLGRVIKADRRLGSQVFVREYEIDQLHEHFEEGESALLQYSDVVKNATKNATKNAG